MDAPDETPEEAEAMKLRSKLMLAIHDRIRTSGASQSDAAKLLGVSLPHFLQLMDGRIDLFSVETLLDMAARLGLKVDIQVLPAR